jgi:hypothetical protein
VLGPTRPVPSVGARARIKHFGGGSENGVVVSMDEDGRRVTVRTLTGAPHDTPQGAGGGHPDGHKQAGGSGGELYEFVLSPASARFVSAGDAHGPRLELLGELG